MTIAKTLPRELPEGFVALSAILPLRPIQDDVHLDHAQEFADRLAVLERRSPDQDDFLETLSLLIETYESQHHEIETADLDPLGTLKYLVEQHEMSTSDVGRLLGQRQLGAKILSGERQLSKTHIARLAVHFRVSPAVFLGPAE
jgi:HTH-type transcriptional regulator/antitoxin HigA